MTASTSRIAPTSRIPLSHVRARATAASRATVAEEHARARVRRRPSLCTNQTWTPCSARVKEKKSPAAGYLPRGPAANARRRAGTAATPASPRAAQASLAARARHPRGGHPRAAAGSRLPDLGPRACKNFAGGLVVGAPLSSFRVASPKFRNADVYPIANLCRDMPTRVKPGRRECVGGVRNRDSYFLATPKGPDGVLQLPQGKSAGSDLGPVGGPLRFHLESRPRHLQQKCCLPNKGRGAPSRRTAKCAPSRRTAKSQDPDVPRMRHRGRV